VSGAGATAPDKRPDGHVFTRAEIAAMSVEVYELNAEAIHKQLKSGGIA
jgi:hypothetical protein